MFPLRFLPLLFVILTMQAHAVAPSGETWYTLNTPHFRVHHTEALETYARVFARHLERALPYLEKDLRWKAPTPIDIVVMDPSDSANGMAMNFPNTRMEVYSVPFEVESALGHYIDWVEELAIHELTHLIANDTTLSYYKALRSIFGSWVKPNGLQPSWIIEGLATYEETRHTKGGRGRSPLLEAMLREATWAGKLDGPDYLSLDRFNDGPHWWPGGNTPYLLGYTIQAGAGNDEENQPLAGAVSEANASRLPFQPNASVKEAAGQDWHSLWSATQDKLAERYGPAPSLAPSCTLTRSGRFTGGHAISGDGWIYFSEEDPRQGFHLARVRADAPCGNEDAERLAFRYYESPTQVAVSPDGKRVAYVESDLETYERFYHTIYLYDVAEEKREMLPITQRGRDPAFLDDNTLLYVKYNGNVTQSIQRLDLATRREETLHTTAPFEKISGLFARGKRLAFALHDNKGVEAIHLMDLDTRKLEAIAAPEGNPFPRYERNPFIAEDGKIHFAAAYGGGTQDIYTYDPRTRKRSLVARGSSGYLDRPVVAEKEIYALEYGLSGLNLVRLPKNPENGVSGAQPVKQDLHAHLTGDQPVIPEDKSGEFPPSVPYSATSTPATSLWPQYWIPLVSATEDGALLGATTSGNDPLEYHSYGGAIQYDTRAKFPVYNVYYRNRQYTTNFQFVAEQENDYFRSTQTSNRKTSYSLAAVIPIQTASFTFGSAFTERNIFATKGQNFLIFHNFYYERMGRKPLAIDPNKGLYTNVYLGLVPSSRNESFFVDVRPEGSVYVEGFRPEDSVALSVHTGFSTNKLLASNYYLGGGVSTLSPSAFVVRGYPVDALLGQRIATMNFTYTMHLASPFRGWGTNPFFLRSYGLRLHGDAGSANFVSRYSSERFLGYQAQSLGKRSLVGTGLDLVGLGTVAYHIPVSVALGVHYGPQKEFGGDTLFYFGVNVGGFGALGAR